MTVEGIEVDTLERLSRLRKGHPVLSVYLDLDPTRSHTYGSR
jgi:hypothetical protein